MGRPSRSRGIRIVPTLLAIGVLLVAGVGTSVASGPVAPRIAATPVATDRTAYAEPFLAVSPTVPRLLIGGAIGHLGGTTNVVSFHSPDGGATWSERSMAVPGFDATYDPSAAFFSAQGAVFADVALQTGGACWSGGSVAVFTSHNAGRTWSPPALIRDERGSGAFADKPTVAADPTTGDVYVAWSQATTSATTNFCQAIPATNASLVAVSHDGGRHFGPPVRIAVPGFPTAFGAAMAVTPRGGLTIAFEASRRSVSPAVAAIFVADSTDGGKTFGPPVRVGPALEPTTPTGANLYATSWPALTTNPDGSLTVAWASGIGNTRIYTAQRSAAHGKFSHPAVVKGPPGADLMPALGPGPVLGFLRFADGVEQPVVTSGGPNGFGPLKAAGPPGPAGSPYELGEYLGVQPVSGRVGMLWPQMIAGHQVAVFARTVVRAPSPPSPPTSSSPVTTDPTPTPTGRRSHTKPGTSTSETPGSDHSSIAIIAVIVLAVLAALALARRLSGRYPGRHRPPG